MELKIIEFYIELFLTLVYNATMEVATMSDEKQKHIFAKNLNYYISLNGKQQNEVAKDIGENPSTLNMWCKGNSLPGLGKIQKLADYFKIGKSDLTDDKLDSDAGFDAKVLADMDTLEMIKKYYSLSLNDRAALKQIIESLYENRAAE